MERDVIADMIQKRKGWIANCDRTIELLQPEWDKFEARTGHNTYVARLYADHFSERRKHQKELEALEAVAQAALKTKETDHANR